MKAHAGELDAAEAQSQVTAISAEADAFLHHVAHRRAITPERLAEALDNAGGSPATPEERAAPLLLDVVARLVAGENAEDTRVELAREPLRDAGP